MLPTKGTSFPPFRLAPRISRRHGESLPPEKLRPCVKRIPVRVIAGTARGVPIAAPKGKSVRPTLDRVREALFSILADRVVNADFLDLFAGTGANGIEALSRGARSALFVDESTANRGVMERNLHKTKLAGKAQIRCERLPEGLNKVAMQHTGFDIVFADPPYDFTAYSELLQIISERNILKQNGLVVIEHDRKKELEETVGGLYRTRVATYGDSSLSFYQYADQQCRG